MPPRTDPFAAVVDLARLRVDDVDCDDVTALTVTLARRALPGAAAASLTLMRDGRAHTAAATGDLARRLDDEQYVRGDGPCLRAASGPATVTVDDLSGDPRWPDWAAVAVSTGVRSALSVHLPVRATLPGSLNLYGAHARAFTRDAVAFAEAFAGCAATAMANADVHHAAVTLAGQMATAMSSRAVIEQAKGIVMARRRCGPDEAFALLVKVSQDGNRKLRDVAVALVRGARSAPAPHR